MCCCGKPIINGQPGYRWQPNDTPHVREVNPPDLGEHDQLLYDEPGRCGGLDAHCHHYRIVTNFSSLFLLVRHGGGDERVRLSGTPTFRDTLAALDSTARYWMLHVIFHAHSDGTHKGHNTEAQRWRIAAAEKRIKTRKARTTNTVKVWIEPSAQWGAEGAVQCR